MDRATVYTQEQGRSVDFLFAQRATMIGLAKLSQAAFGSNTVVHGLAVTPNSPAALNVLVGIGEIYSMTAVDATSWGALGADTTDIILKQGLNMAAQTVSTPAPSTPGYSINYLIEAQYQDEDTNPVVLPFFNSSNPQQPLNGQGGNGAALPSQRQGMCVIQAKAGAAATTGTQVTPTVDSGWTALAVVTVANGQTSVTSGNISVPAGVPQITSLLQMMQTGSPAYAVDSSASTNAISLALTPAITTYTDGQEVTFKAANSNTGPCTINAGGGSVNLVGAAGALQGGEIIAGSQYTAIYSASLGEFVINSQTGGAEQVSPATKSQHAPQMSQVAGVVGSARNLVMNVATASATATLTADEIIVETALGGVRYCLPSFSQTINLATTGAGGMDAGTAPASGFVALYAIYNPTTKAAALLATNATTAAAPSIYSGANMPSGYTASALISVWGTNGSGQFVIGRQADRKIWTSNIQVLSSTSGSASNASASLSAAVPLNAKSFDGLASLSNTSTLGMLITITPSTANAVGAKSIGQYVFAGNSNTQTFNDFPILSPQSLWYSTSSGGSPTFVVNSLAYTF
jgi:hypothetical protein